MPSIKPLTMTEIIPFTDNTIFSRLLYLYNSLLYEQCAFCDRVAACYVLRLPDDM